MAELTTVARPYAQAVFKRAQETGKLTEWSAMLALASEVAVDPSMADIIAGARLSRAQIVDLFVEICGSGLDTEGANLIHVLADNRRLALLPEIAAVYETYRAEAESTMEAEMITAYPVDDAMRDSIAKALAARLGREVHLSATVDKNLLGGAVIRAGDLVIDGSVRGKLDKLAAAMSQ